MAHGSWSEVPDNHIFLALRNTDSASGERMTLTTMSIPARHTLGCIDGSDFSALPSKNGTGDLPALHLGYCPHPVTVG